MFNKFKPNTVSSSSQSFLKIEPQISISAQSPILSNWRSRLSELNQAIVEAVELFKRQKTAKYLLDVLLILFAMPTLLPIFGLIALLIKLDSPGPVFHRRRVLGLGGRPFDALKFRTMYINGNEILEQYPALKEELAIECKLKKDPRVTCIGAVLRKLSLDELPQLFNVLLGQMSLVGPRMISPEEVVNYGEFGDELLTVMPGLTGLWQVSGRSDLTYQERILLDMKYIRDYSISLDLDILFVRTLPAVLKGEGAY